MSDEALVKLLRSVEFFRDIADKHLGKLAGIGRAVDYPAHSIIFREHDAAKDVFVIVSGRVSLIICTPKVGCRELMEVGEGALIGWSPLVGRDRLSDTARTLEPTKTIAIDGEGVLALCRQEPQFGFEFMHRATMVLAQRLSATRLQLLEMGGSQLPDVQIESD